jgi:hypothetical protein
VLYTLSLDRNFVQNKIAKRKKKERKRFHCVRAKISWVMTEEINDLIFLISLQIKNE